MQNLVKNVVKLVQYLLGFLIKMIKLLINPVEELTKEDKDSQEKFEGTRLKEHKYEAIQNSNLDEEDERDEEDEEELSKKNLAKL